MRGGEAFSSPISRSPCFREPVPLNCELHKCFSVLSSLLRWDMKARVGRSWTFLFFHVEEPAGAGYFPSPGQLGSDNNSPAGQALVNWLHLRAGLVEKHSSSGQFKNASFAPPSAGSSREFFSYICCGKLVELLAGSLPVCCGPTVTWSS